MLMMPCSSRLVTTLQARPWSHALVVDGHLQERQQFQVAVLGKQLELQSHAREVRPELSLAEMEKIDQVGSGQSMESV
jgi:hypothetical protein